jgi:two-component system sensor histidine kinase RegB
LATLAAGTAHELASPLSTIAVVVKELTKHLQGADVPRTVIDDVRLIRSELDRCRTVLDSMAGAAGQAVGEEVRHVAGDVLIKEITSGLRREDRQRIVVRCDASPWVVLAPLRGLGQALRGIVQNALDASEPDGNVQIDVTTCDDRMHLVVADRGRGMSRDTLARAGEPFFTTKEPGQGMGLGLFLARSVVERLGGTLRFESVAERGTTARVELPAFEPARLESGA